MGILKHPSLLNLVINAGAFSIYDANDLSNVDESCASALSADINCHPHTRSFVRLQYRSSLENITLTDEICVESCSASLRNWFNTVAEKGNGDDFKTDTVPMQLGGNIWAGWNETCIKDLKTERYCNDIIDEFSQLGDDMPWEDICHRCYRRRLAIKQSSRYSIYNEYYKEKLEKVYKTCGSSGSTDILPPLIPGEKEPPFCFKDKWYTTKEGDICDSISKDKAVSGAMLYMGNQVVINDCHKIPEGLGLCVPTACKTYYVKPEDTCFSIEMALGLPPRSIRMFNSWIDRDYNKLRGGTDFWGKSICVSPLGDAKTLAVIKETWSDQGVLSIGNPPNALRTPPPEDVEVAKGTALHCGSCHVVKKSDTCDDLCENNNTFHRYRLY